MTIQVFVIVGIAALLQIDDNIHEIELLPFFPIGGSLLVLIVSSCIQSCLKAQKRRCFSYVTLVLWPSLWTCLLAFAFTKIEKVSAYCISANFITVYLVMLIDISFYPKQVNRVVSGRKTISLWISFIINLAFAVTYGLVVGKWAAYITSIAVFLYSLFVYLFYYFMTREDMKFASEASFDLDNGVDFVAYMHSSCCVGFLAGLGGDGSSNNNNTSKGT